MLTTLARQGHTQDIHERAVSLRASDEDRERVARALRGHLVAGRLAADEFEQRIEGAYASKTLDELRGLMEDLPPEAVVTTPAATPRGMLMPGNRPFAVRLSVDRPAAAVMSEAMRTIAPPLMSARYRIDRSEPSRLVFSRKQYPFWAVATAILIPLFGLLALVVGGREVSEVVVSANELESGRTIVDVFGVASRGVRRAMLELDR
jgi:hypothetical protein